MARTGKKLVPKKGKKKKGIFKRILRKVLYVFILLFIFSIVQVLVFKWVPPLFTIKMFLNKMELVFSGAEDTEIYYDWQSYNNIAYHMPLAVIAAEDQKFPEHSGFDVEAIEKAIESNKKGRKVRGASTISQQVAKNVFCWPSRSYLRKAVESYYTVLIELLWSKKRIVEVYVNIAEMGPATYGVEAASQRFFNKPASKISRQQAALLAAVLPNPIKLSAKNPGIYVYNRSNWISRQMNQLGGKKFLEQLE